MNKSEPKIGKIGRSQLVSSMAELTKSTKVEAEKMLEAFIKTVEDTLKSGEEIRLVGFGTFLTAKREATTGRNPKTGEEIKIPARIVPKFKAGKQLKDAVAK